MKLTPALHKPIPMDIRVWAQIDENNKVVGTVIGVAHRHVLFHYIVLLDKPLQTDEGLVKAISVPGTLITDLGGQSFAVDLEERVVRGSD